MTRAACAPRIAYGSTGLPPSVALNPLMNVLGRARVLVDADTGDAEVRVFGVRGAALVALEDRVCA